MRIFKKSIACLISLLLLATCLVSCDYLDLITDFDESGEVISADNISASADDFSETESIELSQEDSAGETTDTSDLESFLTSVDESKVVIAEDGVYTTADDVALYIHTYQKLPDNFITKNEARSLGWEGGGLENYAPGKSIGGDRFGNYEGLLPEKNGRFYTECDIDTLGKNSRGAKRIVFSNDGLVYYTDDHYESFTLLYGEE